jgi:hypothetical protein
MSVSVQTGRGDVQAWWSLIADVGFRLVSSRKKRKRKREREKKPS